jgi:hypothetical protein
MSIWGQFNARSGSVVDPWDYQEPASNLPGPCRSIPITDEIRAADAAQQAAREHPASAWKIRDELSVANLRKSRPKVIAKPKSPTVRPHRAPKSTPVTPTPEAMEMKTMARTTCKGGCGKVLSDEQIKNGTDYAWGHKNGCPTQQDGQAAAPKASKVSLDATIEFARRNRAEVEKKLLAFEEQKKQIDVDIERERHHLVVLMKLLDELAPPAPTEQAGVDAAQLVAKHFHNEGSIAPACDRLYPKGIPWPKAAGSKAVKTPAKAPAKKVAKKPAAKKAPAKKPKTMTPAQRKRIADDMKKRWADRRAKAGA